VTLSADELKDARDWLGASIGQHMSSQATLDRIRTAAECTDFARTACRDDRLDSLQAAPLGEDAAPVQRLRTGDESAFEELVRKFGSRLLITARRYLRSEDDACDALQDAFLCAFKSIGRFKGDSQLSTWLHRIVINSALMHLRAKRQRPEMAGAEIDEWQQRFDRAGNSIGEWIGATPMHVSLEIAEARVAVRRCIARLPETYRLVLTLRDIDELGTEYVASLLGLTPSNVKVRLHRARQALKTLMERERGF
jgi:RNA polymerase sigma-70 factor, ECF subfamily